MGACGHCVSGGDGLLRPRPAFGARRCPPAHIHHTGGHCRKSTGDGPRRPSRRRPQRERLLLSVVCGRVQNPPAKSTMVPKRGGGAQGGVCCRQELQRTRIALLHSISKCTTSTLK